MSLKIERLSLTSDDGISTIQTWFDENPNITLHSMQIVGYVCYIVYSEN